MKKLIVLSLLLHTMTMFTWADDTTILRHDMFQVGDVLNYTNNKLGLGTTEPGSHINIQATNADKTIPLIKISQNIATRNAAFGIIFDGSSMSGDPRITMLKIRDLPSQNVLMSFTRNNVIFGNLPSTHSATAATVIVSRDANPNVFSGTLLLVDNATSVSDPSFGTAALPTFGTIRGRLSSRPGAILKIVNTDTTDEIRFGTQVVTTNTYLTVTVLPSGGTERTVFFKITRAVGAKQFVIDHPAKSDRYLVHAAIEAPQADVVYMGTAKLNQGTQIVRLPDYFESLTHLKGRTIRLTRINGFDPLELVTHPNGEVISKGQFTIKSSNPNSSQEFEWEVKATRKDVKPFQVEPLKETIDVSYFGPYSWPKQRVE